ncbi:MAG: type II CAAX endopeptidase family protein [Verrucomicrobiota bacterium]
MSILKPALKHIFVSSEGLRSGWSLAIFLAIYSALTLGAQFAFAHVPALQNWAAAHQDVTPLSQMAFTGLQLLILLVAVIVVGRVESKSFRNYGWARTGRVGQQFLLGLVFGFAMSSVLTGFIAICGGYSITGLAISGVDIFINGLLYGMGFLLIGINEEFIFRGYMQATLRRGIGFWPAAVILSLVFGAVHLPNAGGLWMAALLAACFGLVAAFSVKRTGALWFIVGLHSAFDWSNAFFYSSPLVGLTRQGHLLNASLHGPTWLTGGNAGPVGSVFAFVVIGLAGFVIHCIFPPTGTSAETALRSKALEAQQA